MNEALIPFPGKGFGIVTPARGGPRPSRVLVLLNPGLKPRSGPFRLHVELARKLAPHGITTVRCELPGVGDGGTHAPEWPGYHQQVLHRICEHVGCETVAMGGICSAADDAWRLAQIDERVDGLLLVDPYARGGPWLQWGRLGLLWRRSWSRRWDAVRRLAAGPDGASVSDDDLRDWPDPAAARAGMDRLRARRASLLFVYTGGSALYFIHPRQFRHSWGCRPDVPRVRFEHWRDADHLLMRPQDRERLATVVGDWLVTDAGQAA